MSWEFEEFDEDMDFPDELIIPWEDEEDDSVESVLKYDDEKDEDDEGEYSELPDMREYQQRFSEYSKKKVEKSDIYSAARAEKKEEENNFKKEENQEAMQSPEERGHRWGCGCPACRRFMEAFPELNPALKQKTSPESGETKDRSHYPCGGRLRNEYHNQLKYALGDGDEFRYSPGRRKKEVMRSIAF